MAAEDGTRLSADQVVEPKAQTKLTRDQSLAEQGRQLRAAIDAEYERRGGESGIRGPGPGSGPANDISPLVKQYIKIGMSFDNSESILRSAGFTIEPRGHGSLITGDLSGGGTLDFYRRLLSGKIGVGVSLYPLDPNDFSAIKDISASFWKSTL